MAPALHPGPPHSSSAGVIDTTSMDAIHDATMIMNRHDASYSASEFFGLSTPDDFLQFCGARAARSMTGIMKAVKVQSSEACTYFGLVELEEGSGWLLHARQPLGAGRREAQRYWVSKDPTSFLEVLS